MVDNKIRCKWATGDPLMEEYHDFHWGVPPKNDNELFERMTQQIFQAGLSWKTIWHRHREFYKAFDKFSVKKVAEYDSKEKKRLLNDASIIRNKAKIEATLENAKRILAVKKEFGSFQKFLESIPNELSACQKEMKVRFKFMGPEITRMFVMNIGKIEDTHEKECWRYKKK
ncbi:MAG: DNA-3-methyladenine glycosylase I [Ignavibacteriales bacterium]|nr:DNA-3-methyladenine glycosylase I [Ignavibacteriales bacterium]